MPLAQLISAQQLRQRLDQENLLLLDCRFALEDPSYGRRSYLDGHLPEAYFVDLEQDLSALVVRGVTGRHPLPDPSTLVERLVNDGRLAHAHASLRMAFRPRPLRSTRSIARSVARCGAAAHRTNAR